MAKKQKRPNHAPVQPAKFNPRDPRQLRQRQRDEWNDVSQPNIYQFTSQDEREKQEMLEAAHTLLLLRYGRPGDQLPATQPIAMSSWAASMLQQHQNYPTRRAQSIPQNRIGQSPFNGSWNATNIPSLPPQTMSHSQLARQHSQDNSLSPTKAILVQEGRYNSRMADDSQYFQHPTLKAIHSSPAKRHNSEELDGISDTTELMNDSYDIFQKTPKQIATQLNQSPGSLQAYIFSPSSRNPSQRQQDLPSSPTRIEYRPKSLRDTSSYRPIVSIEAAIPTPELTSVDSPTSTQAPRTPIQHHLEIDRTVPDSVSSIDVFILEARQAMPHRRTASLESYLGRAKASYQMIKKDEDEGEEMSVQVSDDQDGEVDKIAVYHGSHARGFSGADHSSELEEGEIVET